MKLLQANQPQKPEPEKRIVTRGFKRLHISLKKKKTLFVVCTKNKEARIYLLRKN